MRFIGPQRFQEFEHTVGDMFNCIFVRKSLCGLVQLLIEMLEECVLLFKNNPGKGCGGLRYLTLLQTMNFYVCDGQNSIHVMKSWHRFTRPPIATHSPSTLFTN